MPAGALFAANLDKPDYVAILCGELDRLGEAFSELDKNDRRFHLPVRKRSFEGEMNEVVRALLPTADIRLIRSDGLRQRLMAAAHSRAPYR